MCYVKIRFKKFWLLFKCKKKYVCFYFIWTRYITYFCSYQVKLCTTVDGFDLFSICGKFMKKMLGNSTNTLGLGL